jgi:hypothetical protein
MQYMESGQSVPSCWNIMSCVLCSTWSLASQSLPAGPSCPVSYAVHGVWSISPLLLDHHVLCPMQYMESGQSVPSCWTIMSCVLLSAYGLTSQSLPAGPSCPVSCSVHGVWPVSPCLLDHHVLWPMSCRLQGVKAVQDQGNGD